MSDFSQRLLAWFDRHGRKNLPWQTPRTPYRVWLSEIMLQQTQVVTVISYFERFLADLPDLPALAAASQDKVLALWSGLGYYSRARNLHRAAQVCVANHGGDLPRDLQGLAALPGIGPSTAGAILAQAHGMRTPILDGNVKRVLARYHGIRGWPGTRAVEQTLWQLATEHTPETRVADYTQAIMDLGATVCVRARPLCAMCPLGDDCVARREHLTAVLPERKPGKSPPTRTTCMLLLRDDAGRVLLQRRPPAGVWASLWSLPETPSIGDATAHALSLGVTAAHFETLPEFMHAFSHYRLAVQPLSGAATRQRAVRDDADLRWVTREELVDIGLPSPVRKLLSSFLE